VVPSGEIRVTDGWVVGGLGKTREASGKGLVLAGGLWGVGGGGPGKARADVVEGDSGCEEVRRRRDPRRLLLKWVAE
jgi:hypothetical protein